MAPDPAPLADLAPPETSRPHAVFHWGGEQFALDVEGVQEVVADLPLTPLPRAGAGWLGVANLRGEILPAVSLQEWFAGTSPGTNALPVFLVVRTPGGRLALAADRVAGVRAVPPVTAPPVSALGEPEFVSHRWQPPGEADSVRCLDAARLAQKLREQFVLSTLPTV